MRGLNRRFRARGFSLVEILVALLLLSLGLLSMAAMQAYATGATRLAGHRAVAALLAAEAAERVRANPLGLAHGHYDIAGYLTQARAVTADEARASRCAYPDCTPDTLAAYDVALLKAAVRAQLPSGGIELARAAAADGTPSSRDAEVWVVWDEPRLLARDASPPAAANADADDCPGAARALQPAPRCLYLRIAL